MTTKKYKISLNNPCSYGWENMTPNGKGRHCLQCDKTVVDFTSMTDEQVIQYLLTHKNVCGHFKKSQLGRTMVLHEPKKKIAWHWPSVAAMLIAGFFQFVPANTYAKQTSPVVQLDQNHSEKSNHTPKNDIHTSIDKDSLTTLQIKVINHTDKKIVSEAQVTVEGIGSYISDKKGLITMAFNLSTLPKTIQVTAYAAGSLSYYGKIEVATFIKNPVYQLELWYHDPNVDGGEIYIEPQHD